MQNSDGPPADRPTPEPGHAKARAKAERVAREAAALRSNLRKRKDQARQRNEQPEPPRTEQT